jgi:hypothetical protein
MEATIGAILDGDKSGPFDGINGFGVKSRYQARVVTLDNPNVGR